MKKYLIILALTIVAMVSYSQTASFYPSTGSQKINVETNYTLTNTTAQSFDFVFKPDVACTQDFLVNLDSTGGNHTNVAVALYGQKFATSAWTAIGSAVNWKGSTSDTTIVISNATANRYQKYRATFTPTGTGTSRIDLMQFYNYLEAK